ncbi:MAG: VIT domain-containing protein [Planctomycetaceae bacterium]
MKRIPASDRRGNPRGAIACLLVSALSLLCVLLVTSDESVQQQDRQARRVAAAESDRQQIRREWLTAKFVPAPEVHRVAVGDTIETSPTERRRVTLPDGSVLYVNTDASVKVSAPRQVEVTRGEVFVEVVPQFDQTDESAQFEVVTPVRTVTALGTKFSVVASNDSTEVLVTQGSVQVSDLESPIMAGQLLTSRSTALPWNAPPGGSVSGASDAVERTEQETEPSTQRVPGLSPGTRNILDSQLSTLNYRLTAAPRASESLNWTRELITAAAGTFVPASEYAGGAIITVDPNGQETKLSLRKYHVDVHIEDGFARTTIDHTYFNHTSQRLEGTFHFPLPPDASLSRLAMYVNGKLMEGGMAERQHARNTFEQIVSKMKDPALLEWVDGSTFKMRVFPLEARQEKRIVLSYTQRLPAAYGKLHYRFPAGHSMDVVRDWSTAIRVKDGANIDWNSPSHRLESSTDDGDLLLVGVELNSTMERDIVLELGGAVALRDPSFPRRREPSRSALFPPARE